MKSDIDGNSNRGIVAILLLLKGILCAGYFELFDLLHHLRPGLQKDRLKGSCPGILIWKWKEKFSLFIFWTFSENSKMSLALRTLFKANIITCRNNVYQYNCFMCNTKTLEWQYSKRNSSTIIRSWLFRSYMFCYLDLLNLYRWSSSCYAHYRIPIRFSLDLKSGRLKTQREGFKSAENGRSIINFAVL